MEIIFAGGSHYGARGLISLQKYFDKIYIIKENPDDIIKLKRAQDLVIDDFNSVKCPYVFLGGYPKLIPIENLRHKTYINIHGALLPKYRGMHSTFWAIMNGERYLGITFHLVDAYMDSGDILKQYQFEYYGQTVQEINDQIDSLVELHAGEVVFNYINGLIKPLSQNEADAIFGAKRNYDDCLIDFEMSHLMLERYFKALTRPYPLPMLLIKNVKYEILSHELIKRDYYGPIGRAVNINDRGVWIKTADGFLIVDKVKSLEDDNVVSLSTLIKIGYRFKHN